MNNTNSINEQDISRLSNWQRVWDGAYGKNAAPKDPEFDIASWVSSYTDSPISVEEMREWVDASIRPILAIHPTQKLNNRILEIGCGTGLMLYPLLPYAHEYVGIDYSEEALKILRNHLSEKKVKNVKLFHKDATELCQLNQGLFDTVILNSVAQYLPSLDYFNEMIRQALSLLAPGGKIFLGDIRNRNLNETFQASVKLFKLPPDTKIETFVTAYKRKALAEKELLYAPEYFASLLALYPVIQRVCIELRRGKFHNEMASYRYNVVLDTSEAIKETASRKLNWLEDDISAENIISQIKKGNPIHIPCILNSRIQDDSNIEKIISSATRPSTTGELCAMLVERKNRERSMHPEYFWQLADSLGIKAKISWNPENNAYFDVTLYC